MIKHIAVFASAFALASTSAFADDRATPSVSPSPQDRDAKGSGNANGDKRRPGAAPTMEDKQRAVEAATRSAAGAVEPLGNRGPPKSEKNWGEMTPAEKDAARRRWLLNSGDFGSPSGAPKATPKSVPPTKDRGTLIDGTRNPVRPEGKNPAN